MIIITFAVGISAWLILQALGPLKQISHVESARALREFVTNNFTVSQPINVKFGDRGFRFPDLVEAVQLQLDYRLKSDNIPYKYPLIDGLPENIARPPTELEMALLQEIILTDNEYVVSASENAPRSIAERLGDDIIGGDDILGKSDSKKDIPEYFLELYFENKPTMSLDLVQLKAYMGYHLDFIHQNDLPFFLTQAIYDFLLKADLDMRKEMQLGQRKFSDVVRHLNVNFVAAEDLGKTSVELCDAITEFMKQFEPIQSFVNVSVSVQTLDLTKRRPTASLLKNSTTELTFFYSTTMREYADSVYGVHLQHVDLIEKETYTEGSVYGTEYQQQLQKSQVVTYDATSFLEGVSSCVKQYIHLPKSSIANVKLMAESAMKHYTILGIIESLDLIILHDLFESGFYEKLCFLIDKILSEESHDWSSHLTEVSIIHKQVSPW